MPISEDRMKKFKLETELNTVLMDRSHAINTGWPRYEKNCKATVRQYCPFQDEIYVLDGMVFKGDRIIIPSSMRHRMLQKLHEGHLGTDKCQMRDRTVMYWPNINDEIAEMVAKCPNLLSFTKEISGSHS